MSEEKVQYENHIIRLKNEFTEEQYQIEYRKQSKIHHEHNKIIKDTLKLKMKRSRADIVQSIKTLDKIINNVLLNSFSHRIKTCKIKFTYVERTRIQKFLEVFSSKSINPYSFISQKLNSKSLALSDVELAFFLSFPQEKDIRIIKFGVGVSPTFIRSLSQDLAVTDLTKQDPHMN